MFLISNKLEQLEFKLEKIIGIWKHAGKVRKVTIFPQAKLGRNSFWHCNLFFFASFLLGISDSQSGEGMQDRRQNVHQICDFLTIDIYTISKFSLGFQLQKPAPFFCIFGNFCDTNTFFIYPNFKNTNSVEGLFLLKEIQFVCIGHKKGEKVLLWAQGYTKYIYYVPS